VSVYDPSALLRQLERYLDLDWGERGVWPCPAATLEAARIANENVHLDRAQPARRWGRAFDFV